MPLLHAKCFLKTCVRWHGSWCTQLATHTWRNPFAEVRITQVVYSFCCVVIITVRVTQVLYTICCVMITLRVTKVLYTISCVMITLLVTQVLYTICCVMITLLVTQVLYTICCLVINKTITQILTICICNLFILIKTISFMVTCWGYKNQPRADQGEVRYW
jgi:hypothetical protein